MNKPTYEQLEEKIKGLQAKRDEAAKQEPVYFDCKCPPDMHDYLNEDEKYILVEHDDTAQLAELRDSGYSIFPLYRHPPNTEAMIERAREEERERIGNLIHWPECWDTVAYPTLKDAITEINHCTVCENPEAHGYPKDWPQQRAAAIRARKQ